MEGSTRLNTALKMIERTRSALGGDAVERDAEQHHNQGCCGGCFADQHQSGQFGWVMVAAVL